MKQVGTASCQSPVRTAKKPFRRLRGALAIDALRDFTSCRREAAELGIELGQGFRSSMLKNLVWPKGIALGACSDSLVRPAQWLRLPWAGTDSASGEFPVLPAPLEDEIEDCFFAAEAVGADLRIGIE